jgi:alkylation response protein AidB-like acyl-CoA dehydrogenase
VSFVETAQRLADELLFPAALATDAAETVPVELLDALAAAGLYGLQGADFPTVCEVVEALASGCLTTTFVWVQHLGAVRAAGSSDNPAMREWLPLLCSGERRSGLALGGALPGEPLLVADEIDGAWRLKGASPFVSGWGRIDVVHTAARTRGGNILWGLVDAQKLDVERLRLVALNATATVRAEFRGVVLPAERVTSVHAYAEGPTPPAVIRIHAALALGVARRCCGLLGRSELDEQLARCRAELDRLDPGTIEGARAEAGELAFRAAGALAAHTGSRSLLLGDHAQRLVREALFTLVYALRHDSRVAALRLLGAA